jgi:hypothetical protein
MYKTIDNPCEHGKRDVLDLLLFKTLVSYLSESVWSRDQQRIGYAPYLRAALIIASKRYAG